MRILVTGAAGFIGSHLAERLTQLGHLVWGLDCYTDYYSLELKQLNARQLMEKGVDLLDVDLVRDDLEKAITGIDVIYHLAAQPGLSSGSTFGAYICNNVSATHRLLEAVTHYNPDSYLINISSSSVYGTVASGDESTEPKPASYYGVTKLAAEQLVLAYGRDRGLSCSSVRLFSVYGPRERPEKLFTKLIEAILEQRDFPLFKGSLDHQRSYTYVGDIVEGLIAVLDNLDDCNGEILNLGSDKSISTGSGIAIVEDIIGRPVRIAEKPRRGGDQHRTDANIEKVRRILDYRPAVSIREGLLAQVKWYREHIRGKLKL